MVEIICLETYENDYYGLVFPKGSRWKLLYADSWSEALLSKFSVWLRYSEEPFYKIKVSTKDLLEYFAPAGFVRPVDTPETAALKAAYKETNPKDSVGIRKVPRSVVPATVLAEAGLGLLEGARKYGRHNYRDSSVRYSVYYDATIRHLDQWWEGEDIDDDSGLSHVTKAICSLIVLRDAMIQDKIVDDRPPKSPDGWLREMNKKVEELFEKYPEAKEAFTELGIGKDDTSK